MLSWLLRIKGSINPGIDPYRIAGAFVFNLKSGRIVAGEYYHQQLVGLAMLDRSEKPILEIKKLSSLLRLKMIIQDEILEFYLNRVYFGHGAYGVEAPKKFLTKVLPI